MHDDDDGNDMSLQDISESELLVEFMDLMSREGISDYKLRKILDYVERVVSELD